MPIQHGGLVIDIPAQWSDRSSLLFAAPATEGAPTEAIAVTFVELDGDDPQAVLREQAEAARAAHPDLEVLSEGPFECGLGLGWHFVQRYAEGGVPVRQIAVAIFAGAVTVLATAAASESRYEARESNLRQILSSMRAVAVP